MKRIQNGEWRLRESIILTINSKNEIKSIKINASLWYRLIVKCK